MVHHTPVTPLYDERGNLVGRVCEHCAMLLTPSGNPSVSTVNRGQGVRPNLAHKARRKAAARRKTKKSKKAA